MSQENKKKKPYIGCWMEQILAPIGPPPAIPIPDVNKSPPARGGGQTQLRKNIWLVIFYDCNEIKSKSLDESLKNNNKSCFCYFLILRPPVCSRRSPV